MWRTAWATDRANALGHLRACGSGNIDHALDVAAQLVEKHFAAIRRVAAALAERGELTGNEIDALIAARSPTCYRASSAGQVDGRSNVPRAPTPAGPPTGARRDRPAGQLLKRTVRAIALKGRWNVPNC